MEISALGYTTVFKMSCCVLPCYPLALLGKKRWQQNKRHVSLCNINLQHKPSMEKDMGEMCGLLGNVQLGNLEF